MYWADGMQHGLLKSHTTVVAKSVVPRTSSPYVRAGERNAYVHEYELIK